MHFARTMGPGAVGGVGVFAIGRPVAIAECACRWGGYRRRQPGGPPGLHGSPDYRSGLLANRSVAARKLIRANPVIVFCFCYCLVTIVWSDFPLVGIEVLDQGGR